MKKYRASIIITNYNRSRFIDRAIRSCFDQLMFFNMETEVIVVDDGSSDDSEKIIRMYEPNIIFIKHEKNRGVAAASNTGLAKASGDFILRLDADDFLNKMAIYIMSLILIENPDIDFVYTDHFRVNALGFKEKRIQLNTLEALFEHGAGVMFRKKILQKINGYDESLRNCEDYDLLVRVTRQFKGFYLPIALYRYYIHGQNLTLSEERKTYKSFVRKKYGL